MTLGNFEAHLIEVAVEKSRPTRERHSRLSPRQAIQAACSSDQRTSGNWGYWIHHLEKKVAKAIDEDVKRLAKISLDRKVAKAIDKDVKLLARLAQER